MSASQLAPVLDEPMPHDLPVERALLGSIIINNHVFYRIITDVRGPEYFFKDPERFTFAAMVALAERSEPIEVLTLTNELQRRDQLKAVGGSAYLSSLMDGIPDVANAERYAAIVKEKFALRRLIIAGNTTLRAAADPKADAKDVLALTEKALYSIAEGTTDKGFVSLATISRTNLTHIEAMGANRGRLVTGLSTGYDRFNEMTSGFQPADLIILAARPSMGKTGLAVNIAEAIALPGQDGRPRNGGERLHGVGLFSLEMSKEQIGLRILSSESGVSNHLIRSGMLSERNWRDLAEAASRIAKGRIYIDDSAAMDPMEMRAKARRLKMEAGLDMVMVDYLQLMSVKGKTESRQQEVSSISRGLKAIAKELNVPVLALSQLSRRPEQRTGDHRPQLSDLRESGSIEQDADLVCFIYRDEVYNKDTEEKGIAEIIIAKQRNGPIGDFKLVFRNDITKFFNYEPQPDRQDDGRHGQ